MTAEAVPLEPEPKRSGMDKVLDWVERVGNKVPHPVLMMEPVPGDRPDPAVEASYMERIRKEAPWVPPVKKLDRFAFYERAAKAFAVVMTGETARYGNVILIKGVTPVS